MKYKKGDAVKVSSSGAGQKAEIGTIGIVKATEKTDNQDFYFVSFGDWAETLPESVVSLIEENKSIPPIILWLFYSLFFAILLVPFIFTWKWLCGSLVLGHFSSQLNLLRNKK